MKLHESNQTLRSAQSDRTLMPFLSLVLPVRNEMNLIRTAIERLRKTSTLFPVEVIVIDGQSSDQTKTIAEQFADHVIESPKASRSFQMHLGAQKSSGQLLLFLHVDTILPANWQELILETFQERNASAATFQLSFSSEKFFYKLLAFLANSRTKWTGIPHGDQALAVSREIYFSCGGFPDVPLMEEYLFVPRLRRFGKIKIFNETVATSCRKYEAKGPFKNCLKNLFLILLFYLGVSPKKLASWY